jgi:cobalt transporter subunit CbtA
MFRRLLFTAVLGGLAAGILLTGIQSFKVLPLILEAEVHEVAAAGDEVDEAWAPADGLERVSYTMLANTLSGIGFALLLGAAFALRGRSDWREGLLWGLGGFAAFSLAPALGLSPELPGMAAAELHARQIWWVATVSATAGGLGLLAFAPKVALKALGVAIILVPHVVGAPHPEIVEAGTVPAELAAAFVSATLVANLLFWLAVGGVSGYAFQRFSPADAALPDPA